MGYKGLGVAKVLIILILKTKNELQGGHDSHIKLSPRVRVVP